MQDKYELTLEENIFLTKKMLVNNIYSNAKIEKFLVKHCIFGIDQ